MNIKPISFDVLIASQRLKLKEAKAGDMTYTTEYVEELLKMAESMHNKEIERIQDASLELVKSYQSQAKELMAEIKKRDEIISGKN